MDVDGFATDLLLLCPGDESVAPATVALIVWSTTPQWQQHSKYLYILDKYSRILPYLNLLHPNGHLSPMPRCFDAHQSLRSVDGGHNGLQGRSANGLLQNSLGSLIRK